MTDKELLQVQGEGLTLMYVDVLINKTKADLVALIRLLSVLKLHLYLIRRRAPMLLDQIKDIHADLVMYLTTQQAARTCDYTVSNYDVLMQEALDLQGYWEQMVFTLRRLYNTHPPAREIVDKIDNSISDLLKLTFDLEDIDKHGNTTQVP